jgi:hypothetical protein
MVLAWYVMLNEFIVVIVDERLFIAFIAEPPNADIKFPFEVGRQDVT